MGQGDDAGEGAALEKNYGVVGIALTMHNAGLEWQADTVEINKSLVAACPLEGLVRSVLACRQESRVEV